MSAETGRAARYSFLHSVIAMVRWRAGLLLISKVKTYEQMVDIRVVREKLLMSPLYGVLAEEHVA